MGYWRQGWVDYSCFCWLKQIWNYGKLIVYSGNMAELVLKKKCELQRVFPISLGSTVCLWRKLCFGWLRYVGCIFIVFFARYQNLIQIYSNKIWSKFISVKCSACNLTWFFICLNINYSLADPRLLVIQTWNINSWYKSNGKIILIQ